MRQQTCATLNATAEDTPQRQGTHVVRVPFGQKAPYVADFFQIFLCGLSARVEPGFDTQRFFFLAGPYSRRYALSRIERRSTMLRCPNDCASTDVDLITDCRETAARLRAITSLHRNHTRAGRRSPTARRPMSGRHEAHASQHERGKSSRMPATVVRCDGCP